MIDRRRLKKLIRQLWSANRDIFTLLLKSSNTEVARERLYAYLWEKEQELFKAEFTIHPLEKVNIRACIHVFKNVIAPRNEVLTGTSSLLHLWRMAKMPKHKDILRISPGFIEEFQHIFLAISARSLIHSLKRIPSFLNCSGRKAARMRSDDLDRIYQHCKKFYKRYPSGLDPLVLERRARNKRRIISLMHTNESNWDDWQWQLRHIIRDEAALGRLVELTPEERTAIRTAKMSKLAFGITPHYVSLMDQSVHTKRDHAVRSQVIPPLSYIEGMLEHKGNYEKQADFMLERDTSPVDLITRRYPMVSIIKPYNTCPQICQYCQRNWEIDDVLSPQATPPRFRVQHAVSWLKKHPAIKEVLLTGGDPLTLDNEHLHHILEQLSSIDHLERIRICTRTLVTLPRRFTPNLFRMLRQFHKPGTREIVIVTHVEHPYEISEEMITAVKRVRALGISIYNQMVFTIENARRFEAALLRRELKLIGIDPYYTFNTKGKNETRHWRVPIARLLQEDDEESRLFPGMMRLDEPVFNVPRLGKNYLKAVQHHEVIMIRPDGRRVYEFHPWEKNISSVDTYLYTDVSIYDFLNELSNRGENPKDYQTIWYYF